MRSGKPRNAQCTPLAASHRRFSITINQLRNESNCLQVFATRTIETPAFRDFHLSNITCDGAQQALQIRGLPEMPHQNISLENVRIKAKAPGFIVDATDVSCRNVHIQASDDSLVRNERAKNLQLIDCDGFGPAQ